jgi:hypothetical protein
MSAVLAEFQGRSLITGHGGTETRRKQCFLGMMRQFLRGFVSRWPVVVNNLPHYLAAIRDQTILEVMVKSGKPAEPAS